MNPIVTTLSPTAAQLIRLDHTHVLGQYHKLSPGTGATVRDAVVRNILLGLEIHARLEEEIFYPALRQARIESPVLDRSQPEHDDMKRRIEEVRACEGQPAAQMDALHGLMSVVMHHVADEETQLLPAAERVLGASRLSELGAQMNARRMELVKPHAMELVGDLARGAPGKTALLAVGAVLAGGLALSMLRNGHDVRSPRRYP